MTVCLRSVPGILLAVLACWASPAVAETIRIGGVGAASGLLEALAAPFARYTGGTDRLVVIPGLGSGGAISALTAGAISLAVSGRPLTRKETGRGLMGIPFVETPLVFAVSASAAPALNAEDVVAIHSGRTEAYASGEPVRIILRSRNETDVLLILGGIDGMAAALDKARQRPDLPVAATDRENMDYARQIPGAFTTMSLIQMQTEPNALKAARYNGVEPTLPNWRSGAYPLGFRLSLIYRTVTTAGARRFLAFLSTPEAAAIIERTGAVRALP